MNWKAFGMALGVMAIYLGVSAAIAGVGVLVHHLTGSIPITGGAVVVIVCLALAALVGATWDRA